VCVCACVCVPVCVCVLQYSFPVNWWEISILLSQLLVGSFWRVCVRESVCACTRVSLFSLSHSLSHSLFLPLCMCVCMCFCVCITIQFLSGLVGNGDTAVRAVGRLAALYRRQPYVAVQGMCSDVYIYMCVYVRI